MIKFFYKEEWKEFDLGYDSPKQYAISNFGRLVSFVYDIKQGTILKGSDTGGYISFRYKNKNNSKHLLVHRIVAEHFLQKDNEKQKFVIHLDFDKKNNHVENLRWASKEEVHAHPL